MAWTEFEKGTTITASEIVGNFDHIGAGNFLPRTGDNMEATTGVFDLGSQTDYFNNLYCENISKSAGTSNSGLYKLKSETILTATASSIEVTGLNGDNDTDYIILARFISDTNAASFKMIFNGDTGTNYSNNVYIRGKGDSCASGAFGSDNTNTTIGFAEADTTTSNLVSCYIQLNANNKTTITMMTIFCVNSIDDNLVGSIHYGSPAWRNDTATLTTIKVYPSEGTFETGTMFSIWGRL